MLYTNNKNLILHIRQQMLADEVSVTELSSRLGKTRGATSMLFSRGNLSVATLYEIANALDYDLEINLIPRQKQE